MIDLDQHWETRSIWSPRVQGTCKTKMILSPNFPLTRFVTSHLASAMQEWLVKTQEKAEVLKLPPLQVLKLRQLYHQKSWSSFSNDFQVYQEYEKLSEGELLPQLTFHNWHGEGWNRHTLLTFGTDVEACAGYISTSGKEKASMEVSTKLSFFIFCAPKSGPDTNILETTLSEYRDPYLVHAMLVHECIEGRKHFVEHADQILGC